MFELAILGSVLLMYIIGMRFDRKAKEAADQADRAAAKYIEQERKNTK